MKAEAINEMIISENEIQRKIALKFYQGKYRKTSMIYIRKCEVLTDIEAVINL